MRLDERGKQCPLPVIEAKKALESSAPGEKVEVVVDNEIAVQNLTKMADHKGFAVCSEKTGEREFLVTITTGEGNGETAQALSRICCRRPFFYTTAAHSYPVKALIIWKILRL